MNNNTRPNHVALIKQFLANRRDTEIIETGFPFVTISRQSAAGGHTLARCILQHMDRYPDEELLQGWEMFDEKLCAIVAVDDVNSASYESLVTEEYKSDLHQAIYDMIIGRSEQFSTYKKIFEMLHALAKLGKVIMIGRAGAFVTAGMPGGIHIRLVADEAHRVRWAMERLGVDEAKALETVRRQDRDRERLVKEFFNQNVNDPNHYDAVFNASRMSQEDLAEIIVQMIRSKASGAGK